MTQARSGDEERRANRLARESSPYLRQHMHNPVDWWPWGPEALEAARRRGVPIFLSVGYSTCYWCHVMERECFENDSIAAVMNEHFVCIKVDREERPDVDDIYMTAVQMFSQGRGGWPMSVWLTPPGARGPDDRGLEPFYAGTYFPPAPDARFGRPSFPQLLLSIAEHWRTNREPMLEQAAGAADALREQLESDAHPTPLSATPIGQAVSALLRVHDAADGGFGPAPKFPQPVFLEFLLDVMPHLEDPAAASTAQRCVRRTLDRMALGGLYDQVGGGFHRYSTDAQWLVPHFEKMLYDNGQLVSVYARSYRATQSDLDARVVAETVAYVLREMTDPGTGAFFSAQDAEVNGREGQNYLWTSEQLAAALPADDAAFAARLYGLDRGPNFRDPHYPDEPPANVLFMPMRDEELARELRMDVGELLARREAVNDRLLVVRLQRDRPGTDDKILASWNGLMIAGLADAAAALNDAGWFEAAERAAAFVLGTMRDGTGRLLRSWRAGVAGPRGYLEDYAMMAQACTALCRAGVILGRDIAPHLRHAGELVRLAIDLFTERRVALAENGTATPYLLVYDTLADQSDLLVRHRGAYDGAMPSGASSLAHAAIDLYELTRDDRHLEHARLILAGLSSQIVEAPAATVNGVRALHRAAVLDPAIFATFPDGAATDDDDMLEGPVRVFASTDRVAVDPGQGATLVLKIEIDDGYHIVASDPVPHGEAKATDDDRPRLTPVSVRIEGGEGVAAEARWPAAEVFRGGSGPPVMVHAGDVVVELKLRRTAERWSGRPMLVVSYQACSDASCLAPRVVELDVAIDPG